MTGNNKPNRYEEATRKTKIVCTIGPSSEKPEVYREMRLNGLNVARLSLSDAACTMAVDLGARAIVVTSLSGLTVRTVSRFRAPITILGLATGKRAWYKLALSWGVVPLLTEQFPNMEVLYYYALRAAREALPLDPGDTVVVAGGNTSGESGSTNVIRIERV
ncbi:MAG: hypothetical protein K6G17_02845 [Oscillospiraceae bacterium]|nr:hypothetical protein [Oscillospiraceae bacterium]